MILAVLSSRAGMAVAAVAAVLALLAGFYLWASAAGARDVEARHVQQAIEQARGRANADAEANRTADPAERLRRDWSR